MKKLGSIFFILILIMLVAWQLPWCLSMLNSKKSNPTFVLYSTLIDDFIVSSTHDGKRVNTDTKKMAYTQAQADSLLPFFYARQLLKDEKFPDSVKGVATNYRDSQHETFFWRSSPRDLNTPKVGVYQMMESASQRVQLETPTDIFRINKKGIEFIDAQTNMINPDKSARFTDMMIKKGFSFPSKSLSGNPSVKKEYDEGYLFVDNNNQLFHVKQMLGRPYVRKIELPIDVVPQHVFITEHRNRKSIGYMVSNNGQFYVVQLPGYHLKRIDIPSFDPQTMSMMIYANPFDWTFKIAGKDFVKYYAVDAHDYRRLSSFDETFEDNFADDLVSFFTSIGLRFTSPLDKYVYPRIGI